MGRLLPQPGKRGDQIEQLLSAEIWPCQPGLLRAGQQRRTGGARATQALCRADSGSSMALISGRRSAMLMGKRHALGQPLQQRRGRIGGEKRLQPGG